MSDPRLIMKRFGGSRQLRLESVEDLKNVLLLPETHWAILSCPVKGLNCDERFLEIIDDDRDGRIGTQELKRNIEWTLNHLKTSTDFQSQQTILELKDLNESSQKLKESASILLENLDAKDKNCISLEQLQKRDAILSDAGANGDGVITINCIEHDPLKNAAKDILSATTPIQDRNGRDGLNHESLQNYLKLRDEALNLYQQGEGLQFWEDDTELVVETVISLNDEIVDWFSLAELKQVNPELAQAFINQQGKESHAKDRQAIEAALASQLIAEPQEQLTWESIRPTKSGKALLKIQNICFGEDEALTQSRWQEVFLQASSSQDWKQRCSANPAYKLGKDKLNDIDDAIVDALKQLCDHDLSFADDINTIQDLEKLILCKRWLLPFSKNFVSIPYLFDHETRAMFEQGSLLIAGSEYHLAVRVNDRKTHIKIATNSGMCICYVEISGDQPPRKFEVAVPITAGTKNALFLNRRGIFHDINGVRLEAKIVHIIDNPVSIKEAVLQPFTRIGNFFSKKIDEWSSVADKNFDKQIEDVVNDKKAKAPAKESSSNGVGNALMGGSIAFAALGSSIAFITKQLSEIQPLKIFLGLAILVFLIMVPSAINAALKLRRRNLSALLQASSWAVNERMRLSYSLARLLSSRPKLPKHAISETRDEIESTLKRLNIEDERIEVYQLLSLIFCVSSTALVGLDALLYFFHYGNFIWLPALTLPLAVGAVYCGLRSWQHRLIQNAFVLLISLGSLGYGIYRLFS